MYAGEITERDIARFWKYVNKTDGCWLWTGFADPGGYGRLNINKTPVVASQLSWRIHFGLADAGLFVCHHCDAPGCVNPAHLFLGTPAENSRDMSRKGRSYWGERHYAAKLTADQVRFIRASELQGKELARMFGVWPSAISKVRRGQRWAHA